MKRRRSSHHEGASSIPAVIAEHDPSYPPGWYLARCGTCRTILSRYDWEPEEALRNGEAVLRKGEHACKPQNDTGPPGKTGRGAA